MFCRQLQNCGAFVNWNDAKDVMTKLRDIGWTPITASQIPSAARTYFLTRFTMIKSAWFIRLEGVNSSAIILPVGTLLDPASILLPGDINLDELPER